MTSRHALLIGLAAAGALAGCRSEGDLVIEQGVGITALRSTCPAVGVPLYLGDVTLFSPPGSETADAIEPRAAQAGARLVTRTKTSPKVGADTKAELRSARHRAGERRGDRL